MSELARHPCRHPRAATLLMVMTTDHGARSHGMTQRSSITTTRRSHARHDHDDAHHDAGHHADHNLLAAYVHVLADAVTSVLAIAALVAGRYLGWVWLDAAMGLVGAAVILRWAFILMRQTARVLLDSADPSSSTGSGNGWSGTAPACRTCTSGASGPVTARWSQPWCALPGTHLIISSES